MDNTKFDLVFEGTMAEQKDKAERFATGLRKLVVNSCAEFANSVLYDREQARVALKQVREYEAAHETFCKDPRGVILRAWVEKTEAEQAAGVLANAIVEVVLSRGHH